MKLLKTLPFVMLALLASATGQAAEELPVVSQVDFQRYAGTWYEIARLPNRFERDCARNITATYKLLPESKIDVLNQCVKADGTRMAARGLARSSDGSTSRLEVRFAPAWLGILPFVWGDYWVMALDPDYRWSLVGSPDREYLWILSRTPHLPEEKIRELLQHANKLGFATENMVRVSNGTPATGPAQR